MFALLVFLQTFAESRHSVQIPDALIVEVATPRPAGSPFDSVPQSLVLWKGDLKRTLTLAPAGIDNGPFGDRPHGVGVVFTITLMAR